MKKRILNKSRSNIAAQAGFTLVELAIVLVIIGLIISSVLVGQDLVRGAELRASVTQYEQFNAAVGTFRGKYGGLPGDVLGATNYGFVANSPNPGDGILYPASSADGMAASTANNLFWNYLGSSGAGLIPGSYTGNVAIDTDVAGSVAGTMPEAKAGNYWGVFAGVAAGIAEGTVVGASGSEAGSNFFILGVVGDADAGDFTTAETLTPLEAKNMDEKVDDGLPSIGIVRARGAGNDAPDTLPTHATAAGTTTCVQDATAADAYAGASVRSNKYQTTGTTALCTLRFKMAL